MDLNTGDTAWVLIAAALVLFMTPGLALFYGGMVRAKNVLAMLMQNFFAMGIVTIIWVLFGFSLAFGDFGNGGFIGNFDYAGLDGMTNGLGNFAPGVPDLAFVAFQLTFAVITPALITGAIADRMRWAAWVGFITLWSILVYLPVAHWIFGGGWLAEPRRARLRRRRGRARERGRRGTRPRDPARQAARLAATPDAAALAAAHAARYRHPVVRLVRLQRRLGARREPASPRRRSSTRSSRPPRR